MHMSGPGVGEVGHRQGPGAGAAQGSCNPRKFSEKIALHTQRQAEDAAAFREVMMDITSIRVQAERVREASGTVPYYGGSLPNVNQILRSSTDTQYPGYLTQQLTKADEGYRDIQPSLCGRPHRRHFDSAPYLSTHLSPPRGPAWRSSSRNWSSCSATEKSQMVRLPLTALNRTNSDSALHTSVRNIHLHGHPKSAQVLNPHTKHMPLYEENIQEETACPKIKKLSSMAPSGSETSVVQSFPLPDQQLSSLPVPTAHSMSGSLPDLSSLHLPSPLPVGQEPERQSFTAVSGAGYLSATSAHRDNMTDFNLPGLSSSLEVSLRNPLLESSLSSPSIQSSLSSLSLPSSLSSTSSHLSLSNSSLPSSLSNQSLQSSLSSSSLSNQSVQSSASRCSYSSGIGGSRSCSSSSLSGSPRLPGHAHAAGSRKRAQLSPLIVSSGGESRWQHPKQFSPTLSPTRSSVTQSALLNPNKVLKDTKPPAYPCSQTGPPMSHQPVRQYLPPESQHQSIPEMEQWSQDYAYNTHQSEHRRTHSLTQQPLFDSQQHIHKQTLQLQHHLQPQMNYHQQLMYSNTRHQQALNQPHIQQHHPSKGQYNSYTHLQFQDQQLSEEQYRCLSPWQLPCQQGRYQGHQPHPHQQLHQSTPFLTNAQEKSWSHMTCPQDALHRRPKRPLGPCIQTQELRKPQFETERRSHSNSREGEGVPSSPSSRDKGFELNRDCYAGLHLTPSQAKALSQQLGALQREPLGGSRGSNLNFQAAESNEHPLLNNVLPQQTQSSAGEIININLSEPLCWLDQDFTGLPDSVLEFDLESFGLEVNETLPSLEDLSYVQ